MKQIGFIIALAFLPTCLDAENLPREFAVTPRTMAETPPFLTQLSVPHATCAAVSESLALAVVGHHSNEGKHLAVFSLDGGGIPQEEPVWITLPKPDPLASHSNYPLGLLFHPTLPLLYIWQDIDAPPPDEQLEKNPALKPWGEFDHLLIYKVGNGALELVHAGAHGFGFHLGQRGGTVGLDFESKHLFVPNTRGESPLEGGIAYFQLDEEGLPAAEPEETPKNQQPKGLEIMAMQHQTTAKTRRAAPKKGVACRKAPSGLGWVAEREAVIMGGNSGCLMADFHDGSLRRSWFDINDLANVGWVSIAAHSQKPVMYLCLQDSRFFYSIGQVNGWVSLLPQKATFAGSPHLYGPPVVLDKHAKVVVGDANALHFLGIDSTGRLDGTCERLPLPAGLVQAFTYSSKHDRLYVAVDSKN